MTLQSLDLFKDPALWAAAGRWAAQGGRQAPWREADPVWRAREKPGVSVKSFVESHLHLKMLKPIALKSEANTLSAFLFFPGVTSLWGAGWGGLFFHFPGRTGIFLFFFFFQQYQDPSHEIFLEV